MSLGYYIKPGTTTQKVSELLSDISQLRALRDRMREHLAVMIQSQGAGGADKWKGVETLYGYSATDRGGGVDDCDAHDAYDNLVNVMSATTGLNAADFDYLFSRMG